MIDFDNYTDVSDEYQYLFDNLPTTVIFDITNNSRFNNKTYDGHPDVICHLNHVNTIYNSIGLTINPTTVDHFNKLQEHIVTELTNTNIDMSWNEQRMIFAEILCSNNLSDNKI
jgi:hypothetical protein